MREIKFRAFDKSKNRMVYTDWRSWRNWYNQSNGGKVVYGRGGIIETMLSEPMQYTGLKDKNGKEIYEGDIMHTEYADHIEESGIGQIFVEITFRDGSFGWIGDITGDFHPFSIEQLDDYEIVGNIYENKELLNQK